MEPRTGRFNPANYSDVPLYNIQAVAAATGVPAITLRSWERRYGVPEPKRDPKGYRLYSERDIAVALWLKERVQQGVGISRAVNMLRAREAGELPPDLPRTLDFETLRARLLNGIDSMDEAAIAQVVAEALAVASVEDVALRLLQPALYEVGQLWNQGALSVTTEHVGSNLLRAHLVQLIRITPPPIREARILVGCAPGEFHDIGPLMLNLFLRRRGFDVVFAGASVEPEGLIADVRRLNLAAVCLSASSAESAAALRALFQQLDGHYSGVRGFGGRIFNERGDLAASIPGEFLGSDA
ncbi:MAG: MerR family transcriptional regulator, partial [Chloroflexi bacterium]|nr:MerR family transcriptional regulator [Chloroflexota bacterium]